MTGTSIGKYMTMIICFIITLTTESRTKYTVQYKLLPSKYNFPQADHECRRRGFFLPFVNSNLKEIQSVMLSNQINSIWLSVKRQEMDGWRWVDNSKALINTLKDESFWDEISGRCGTFNYPKDKLMAHSCSDQHICFVCSLPYAAADCGEFSHYFNKTGHVLAVGSNAVSWFVARKYCLRCDGDLQKIDTEDKRKNLRDDLTKSIRDIAMDCNIYYIGLQRDHWVSIHHGSVIHVDLKLWSSNEPSKFHCAEYLMTKNEFSLKTKKCTDSNYALCLSYAEEIKSATDNAIDECLDEKKQIKHSKSKISHLEGMKTFFIVLVVAFGCIIAITVAAVVYIYHGRKKTTPKHIAEYHHKKEEEEKAGLNSDCDT